MATLTGNTIASTYTGLLSVTGAVGADTVEAVTDGAGTSTSLSLSQQRATITLGSGAADDFIVDGTTFVVEGDNNRVGIGTASPGKDLEIYNATAPTIKLNDGGDYEAYIILSGNDLEFRTSSGVIEFYTGHADGLNASSTVKLSISAAGSIIPASLGTLNTHYGDGAGDAIQSGGNYNTLIGHDAGGAITTGDANVLMGDSAGDAINIGVNNCAIGNDALTAEDVGNNSTALGNAALASQNSDSNNEVTENTGVGYAAGYYNVTGTGNTSVGYYSMLGASGNSHNDNTALGAYSGTAITGADSNVLIGYRAGDALTTGSNNVAVGKHALGNNTDVDKCVAIGSAALSQSNITSAADGTVGVGYFALGNLTTGGNNVAVGNSALIGHTTGHRNIAIGRDAMGDTDAGTDSLSSSDNVFIGMQAGGGAWADTTCEYNIGIGSYALDAQLNDADANIAMGYNALTALTQGDGNVAIGHQVGTSLDTGAANVLIGYQSGTDTVALTSGSNNVLIGTNVRTPANSTANCIVIGHDIDASADSVAIGKASNKIQNTFTSNATWTRYSDQNLKTNINTTDLGLSFINKLKPITFNWKDSKDFPDGYEGKGKAKMDTTTKLYGMLAQEVKTALDEVGHSEFGGWSKDSSGIESLAQSMFIYPLINAVQELTAKVKELETKLNNKES